jgi:hypothetical protein
MVGGELGEVSSDSGGWEKGCRTAGATGVCDKVYMSYLSWHGSVLFPLRCDVICGSERVRLVRPVFSQYSFPGPSLFGGAVGPGGPTWTPGRDIVLSLGPYLGRCGSLDYRYGEGETERLRAALQGDQSEYK